MVSDWRHSLWKYHIYEEKIILHIYEEKIILHIYEEKIIHQKVFENLVLYRSLCLVAYLANLFDFLVQDHYSFLTA